MRKALLLAMGLGPVVGGCRCGPGVNKVPPQLGVSTLAIDFGPVKLGATADQTLTLSAQTQASVNIASIAVADGPVPGAAGAYQVLSQPSSIPPLGNAQVTIRFTPGQVQDYPALLNIVSNDPHSPTQISLDGQGAVAQIALVPSCPQNCAGSVDGGPPASIDFGLQPAQRLVPIPSTRLPTVDIRNVGTVGLSVTKIDIEGPDAPAFSIVGNPQVPTPQNPLSLDPGTGESVTLGFQPTSTTQQRYQANLVVGSDDPTTPNATVALAGELSPDQPPQVCANIITVQPTLGPPVSYDTPQIWATLLTPPDGGYDFTRRDIEPRWQITFSAYSSPDAGSCTTDPEDQRQQLSFLWQLTSQPPGSAPIAISNSTQPVGAFMTPVASGLYTVLLTVKDRQGNPSSTSLTFEVAFRQDLVAELSWNQPDGGFPDVDLDLHLIRPSSADGGDPFSGAFSFFDEANGGTTSGDINAYAVTHKNDSAFPAGAGFDWGQPGLADDPTLNFDDTGKGALIENISLNYPENDPACATQSCAYKVMVHYFTDGRTPASPPPCTVSGCQDGESCDCPSPSLACVANIAPAGAPATGAGACFLPPQPVVRIYVKANPTPAAVIPLDTLTPPNDVVLPAPCQMLYVADVIWPSKAWVLDGGVFDGGSPVVIVAQGADATGRIDGGVIGRFGQRLAGAHTCTWDVIEGNSQVPNWFAEEPR